MNLPVVYYRDLEAVLVTTSFTLIPVDLRYPLWMCAFCSLLCFRNYGSESEF